MAVYLVWDWWFDVEKNIYYAIVEESDILYFSEAPVPDNLKDVENG